MPERKRESEGESASVGGQQAKDQLKILLFGQTCVYQKGEECIWRPIKINEKSEKDR